MYLIDSSFQAVKRLLVLSPNDNEVTAGHKRYFLPNMKLF